MRTGVSLVARLIGEAAITGRSDWRGARTSVVVIDLTSEGKGLLCSEPKYPQIHLVVKQVRTDTEIVATVAPCSGAYLAITGMTRRIGSIVALTNETATREKLEIGARCPSAALSAGTLSGP